jgi:hypothetical protein
MRYAIGCTAKTVIIRAAQDLRLRECREVSPPSISRTRAIRRIRDDLFIMGHGEVAFKGRP